MALINITSLVKRVGGFLTPAPTHTSDTTVAAQSLEPSKPERALEPKAPASRREQLLAKCYALGKELARTTRTLKPDPALLKTVEEHVVSMATAEALPPFDPATNDFDRRVSARLANLDGRLEQGEDQFEMAAAERRRREDELAKLGELQPRPAATSLLRWSSAIGITLTLAPAIHDFLLSGMFPLLKWLVAIGFGGAFSLFIVTAILPDDEETD